MSRESGRQSPSQASAVDSRPRNYTTRSELLGVKGRSAPCTAGRQAAQGTRTPRAGSHAEANTSLRTTRFLETGHPLAPRCQPCPQKPPEGAVATVSPWASWGPLTEGLPPARLGNRTRVFVMFLTLPGSLQGTERRAALLVAGTQRGAALGPECRLHVSNRGPRSAPNSEPGPVSARAVQTPAPSSPVLRLGASELPLPTCRGHVPSAGCRKDPWRAGRGRGSQRGRVV